MPRGRLGLPGVELKLRFAPPANWPRTGRSPRMAGSAASTFSLDYHRVPYPLKILQCASRGVLHHRGSKDSLW
jgi:hypothetical protein